jgi:membrane protein YqaA with SNARE-associated domain
MDVQQAVVFFQYALHVSRVLRRLGGIGLLVLGLMDGALIPLPGSMDALTIVLAPRHNDLWFYYAMMATVGSTVGGSLTYRFALMRASLQRAARNIADRQRRHVAVVRFP